MPAAKAKKKASPPQCTTRLTPFRLQVLELLNDNPHGWLEATEIGEKLWPDMVGPGGPRQGGPNSWAFAATNQLSKLAAATGWVAHHFHPPSPVQQALGSTEWSDVPRSWEITRIGRTVLLDHYQGKLKEALAFCPRLCFTCDGQGTLCDICGESNAACICEVEDESAGLSPCWNCQGSGIAPLDFGAAMRKQAALMGCVWMWDHDAHGSESRHALYLNGKQLACQPTLARALQQARDHLFPSALCSTSPQSDPRS